MNDADQDANTLDELAAAAVRGDATARERLLAVLRVRFRALAKRRVESDDIDDVVQESLSMVHMKLELRPASGSLLPWSYAVLRNVIGNHYKKRDRLRRREAPAEDIRGVSPDDPAAALESREIADRLRKGLERLAAVHPRCALLFQCILRSLEGGGAARQISTRALQLARQQEPDLTRDGFYAVLHRCRRRLREILDESSGEDAP
ncbi:MAG: hypothetical protein GF355_02405 [Candidatus Eisenbacteria bacterium]|nr:hypothetical protein [Candidatus Eisenbacteria bacterium]